MTVARRGQHTVPSPVDRGRARLGRAGSKHHLLTDGHGTPLAILLTGGNRNDVTHFLRGRTASAVCASDGKR